MTKYNDRNEIATQLANLAAKTIMNQNPGTEAASVTIEKINRVEHGIKLSKRNTEVSPVIYLSDYIRDILKGYISIENAAKEVARQASVILTQNINLKETLQIGLKKENLFAQVISTKMNANILSKVPHRDVNDLSIIPRCKVDDIGTCIVSNSMSGLLRLTPEEVLETAIANTKSDNYYIRPLYEVLYGESISSTSNDESNIYVVSNTDNYLGAAGVFVCHDLRKKIASTVGEKFFIIPSSIHEVLIFPDRGTITAKDLEAIVHDVNTQEVAPADRLSYSIYHVNNPDLIIKMANMREETPITKETKTIIRTI